MTQNEIIEMARQSGWTDDLLEVSFVTPMLERFAKLVAAKRTWVGLTADEIWDEWLEQSKPERNTHNFVVAFTRAIEAKLKDKNCAG